MCIKSRDRILFPNILTRPVGVSARQKVGNRFFENEKTYFCDGRTATVVVKKLETEVSVRTKHILEKRQREENHVRKLCLAESQVRNEHHSGRQQVGNISVNQAGAHI